MFTHTHCLSLSLPHTHTHTHMCTLFINTYFTKHPTSKISFHNLISFHHISIYTRKSHYIHFNWHLCLGGSGRGGGEHSWQGGQAVWHNGLHSACQHLISGEDSNSHPTSVHAHWKNQKIFNLIKGRKKRITQNSVQQIWIKTYQILLKKFINQNIWNVFDDNFEKYYLWNFQHHGPSARNCGHIQEKEKKFSSFQ